MIKCISLSNTSYFDFVTDIDFLSFEHKTTLMFKASNGCVPLFLAYNNAKLSFLLLFVF
jgi:hypothetical protein